MLPDFENSEGTASRPISYKPDPGQYRKFRRDLIIRASIVLSLVYVGLAFLFWHLDRESYLPGFLGGAVGACFAIYRLLKQQQSNRNALEFTFRDAKLVRRLDGYPVLELAPNEITAIVESPKGITVKTKNHLRKMFVAKSLLNYDAFRSQIASWAPNTRISEGLSPRDYLGYVFELLTCAWVFGGPLFLLSVNQREVVIPLGIVLFLSMLAMILYVRKSPYIPTTSQRGLWFLLLLPIFGVLVHFF